MRSRSPLLILLSMLNSKSTMASAAEEQCHGYTPMPSVSSFLGATLSYSTAERICCNNKRYAECSGYLDAPEVDLFGRLDPVGETVFYDSVCGIPLFVAPRGRSFEEFRDESLGHGWPSFRPEELVSENVVIHDDGRMESRCLTHLGHNLPEGGEDRYCVDLVCVAGSPLPANDERAGILLTLAGESAIVEGDEFDPSAYTSSAPMNSGKGDDSGGVVIVVIGAFVSVAIVAAVAVAYLVAWRKGKGERGKGKAGGHCKTDDEMEEIRIE
ncbi:hypothetical protein ACHAW5_005858 [Stephanodiscus triporus]|uniref:Peptide-methionine (R)-S-oxide reductase n=1 Tax=Stephanodiscus triporus TaxID=2934178 RepID=A0ABD3MX17_9STRA